MNSFVMLSLRRSRALFQDGCTCSPMFSFSQNGVALLVLAVGSVLASKVISGNHFFEQ